MTRVMTTVCVFCGSRPGNDPQHMALAAELGGALANAGHPVVYGGASIGCMGAVADAALAAGGEVIGVIPSRLVDLEVAHPSLTEQHIVESMAERKQVMFDRSDAYVVLPGSIGTLDELFEVWTLGYLRMLGETPPPIWVLDPSGYFDPLLAFMRTVGQSGFMSEETVAMVKPVRSVPAVLEALVTELP